MIFSLKFCIKKLKAAFEDVVRYFLCCLFFFMICQTHIQAAEALKLISLRAIGDNMYTRIIVIFDVEPNFHLQILDTPARLIINLPLTDFSLQKLPLNKKNILSGIVSDVRYGFSDIQSSRIILTSDVVFSVEKTTVQKLDNGSWQMLIDIALSTQQKFNEILKKQQLVNNTIKTQQPNLKYPFRVTLDPGHGGIDSGAQGITGILEKDITLAFALALRDELEKNTDIDVMLTRDSDVFLRLNERIKKAQKFGADLFISIHADTINTPSLRGATVYTISDKASDAMAKTLAESENKVDLLDGLPAEELPEVADILIDLTQRETHTFSVNFADRVILNLSNSNIHLINNPHRYADFQVLKAPDVPSVLIEIGYLSNKEDEELLSDPQWRKKMAASIAHAILQFSQYQQKIMQAL
ncbi:hypothetical protein H704_00726 [Bartonella bacilliformis Peru38]|uniref:N-acetylmuramoyl-L-alanine amidase n=2 Tax=Bartonella bacilliformis TaxID=774 RepID=A1USY9_BARBK|nr:N-acetylmuramoyl-L-alanine amidase [Bartonella bacilliformis]ABM45349.1 N-acetylmuramoyl-l-alanine amidase family protein [Bartonella bacilliformis KC583]AMG85889.1 N-acetylmuramoyl-L-alanine amidase [Bartonella bacilliformis]EKS44166.1 N-acetylmuramoyl-L-alanine amidase [Bartonella bacilliformis INS]EYS89903.1 hypothetical protein X472_00348 [Bartonella bacilliformis San Pedro600-02]KEG20483.1 hypothetical protein H704_00726 [Bartonella bacilliformis Peru38]